MKKLLVLCCLFGQLFCADDSNKLVISPDGKNRVSLVDMKYHTFSFDKEGHPRINNMPIRFPDPQTKELCTLSGWRAMYITMKEIDKYNVQWEFERGGKTITYATNTVILPHSSEGPFLTAHEKTESDSQKEKRRKVSKTLVSPNGKMTFKIHSSIDETEMVMSFDQDKDFCINGNKILLKFWDKNLKKYYILDDHEENEEYKIPEKITVKREPPFYNIVLSLMYKDKQKKRFFIPQPNYIDHNSQFNYNCIHACEEMPNHPRWPGTESSSDSE